MGDLYDKNDGEKWVQVFIENHNVILVCFL